MTDDDCVNQSRCIAPPSGEPGDGICYAPKHRYLSIARHPDQVVSTARRVTLQDGPVLGWVGKPYTEGGLVLADVISAPVYDDIDFTGEWPSLLHVMACEVATGQTYLIQAIVTGQDTGDEGNYSEALILHTPTKWGDNVGTCTNDVCNPPQGVANLDDVMAKIKRFQAIPVAPMTWLDDDPSVGTTVPNQTVGLADYQNSIKGFQGQPYPGDGPLDCD
jgi:hypothetical protein